MSIKINDEFYAQILRIKSELILVVEQKVKNSII